MELASLSPVAFLTFEVRVSCKLEGELVALDILYLVLLHIYVFYIFFLGGMYSTLKPELLTATNKQRQMMQSDPMSVIR